MVGAHVEEVAPRRVVRAGDALALAILVVASICLHAWIVSRTNVTARDGIRFARTALHLESPEVGGNRSIADVFRDSSDCPDPPGYPIAVLLVSKVVQAVHPAPLQEQMLLAAQIAACIAGVLLAFPSYWLGRMLFASPFAGFAAALLFQVLPTAAQITSDALSDSTCLLLVLLTLVCGVRAVRTWSTLWFIFTGVAAGCGYLVRPEGLIGVPAVGLVLLVGALARVRPAAASLSRAIAMLAGLCVIASPYMALIGGVSNKPTVNEQIRKLIPFRVLVTDGQANAKPAHPALLAEWYSGSGSQWLWAARAIVKETSKTAHYAIPAFAFLGLWRFRHRLDAGFAVVLACGALQICVLFLLAMKPMPADLGPGSEAVPPYVSERHTLLLAYLCCLFTGGWLASGVRNRLVAWLLLAALVAASLPGALKPLHANRAGHLHAGRFLAGSVGPGDALIDPFAWAQWYSGQSLYGVPEDPGPEELRTRWVVWEPTAGTKQNPHSRLPRLEAARNVVNDRANPPQVAYFWPEDATPETARVVVYRQVVK